MKYCISQLFESFLRHYYAFIHDKKIEDSTYDFHFEAIIEFIENIGDTYDSVDEKERNDRPTYYEEAKAHVLAILNITSPPNKEKLELLENLSPDEYFKLLDIINADFIKKNFPRLSALLQNLVERRKNKWQKHLSMADGPKKLKDIQEDINKEDEEMAGKGKGNTGGNQKEKEREKEKAEQEKLDKKVKELFEGWEMGKNEELREIKEILRKYNERQFYLSFLRQVADEKKDNVSKRVTLFPVILNSERFSVKDFKNAWIDAIKFLAIGSGDFPFCGAALAKVLQATLEKEGKLDEYFQKFEDEDEEYFMEEVLQKYYHYSQNQDALKFVKPKAKYSGLI